MGKLQEEYKTLEEYAKRIGMPTYLAQTSWNNDLGEIDSNAQRAVEEAQLGAEYDRQVGTLHGLSKQGLINKREYDEQKSILYVRYMQNILNRHSQKRE